MPTDFPNSPTQGQIYTGPNGNQWQYDGVKWVPAETGATVGPFLPLAGGAMTGDLTLAADPVAALDATTKEYADAGDTASKAYADTHKLDLTGGTVTGPVLGVTATAGDSSTKLATTAFVNAATAALLALPVGGMCLWPTAVAPTNFLLCNGSVYNNTDAPKLAAVLGNTFGGTAGSTFAVPNVINRMIVGAGGSYALAATGGEATHTLALAEIPSHAHGISDPGHNHGFNDPGHNHSQSGHGHGISDPAHAHTLGGSYGYGIGASAPPSPLVNSGSAYSGGSGTGIGVQAQIANLNAVGTGCYNSAAGTGIGVAANGSSGAHNNMPPYLALNMIIRYQ